MAEYTSLGAVLLPESFSEMYPVSYNRLLRLTNLSISKDQLDILSWTTSTRTGFITI